MEFPKTLFSGYHGSCHCQGIAVDEKNGYVYYSFTTKLVKSDLQGRVVGSVDGLVGHLGCIDFCEEDGRVYGSLEFKNDSIGKGILKALNAEDQPIENAFYCAIFDVDRIDRPDMNAELDGVMRAVYLPDVVEDFEAHVSLGGKELEHRYGCSGIDGTAWGPDFGANGGKAYLQICYGVYGDVMREDNDYQVILCYDALDWWNTVARPLCQTSMHRSGARCLAKRFLYTGSTNWGVQNLEYDSFTENWIAAVYRGSKPQFPNYRMFVIDGNAAPKPSIHRATGEKIEELSLVADGEGVDGIFGNNFPYGSTGVCAFGDGSYYFSQNGSDSESGQFTKLVLYRATGDPKNPFREIED